MDIAEIFHRKTKMKYEKGLEKQIDSSTSPREWTTVYFKEYPRMPKIMLSKPKILDFSLGKSLIKRQSERRFNGKPIKIRDISQLLFYSTGITRKNENWDKNRRSYPSAGGCFPLEIYLFNLQASNEFKKGIYHYNIKEHSLEKILKEENLRKKVYPEVIWQDLVLKAPLILVISAVFERNMMKYRDRGYRYILFEAGHLGQNIHLTAPALGLKCCAIGGFDDDKFNQLLDIDGDNEGVIYAFILGY